MRSARYRGARRAARPALAGALLCAAAPACNALLGIEEPVERAGATGTGGEATAASVTATGAGGDGGGTIEIGDPPCAPDEPPVDTAVFVAPPPLGDDEANKGTRLRPVATIQHALELAAGSDITTIYLQEGTYPESVVFGAGDQDIVVEGGWVADGERWTRNCAPGIVGRTVIAAPSPPAVTVRDGTQMSGLRSLTVETPAALSPVVAQEGISSYGVWVERAMFQLEWVKVVTGAAAPGGESDDVLGVPMVPTCDGVNGCCNRMMVAGCGAPEGPEPPPAAAPGATSAGVFAGSGYQPGNGGPGPLGTRGVDGASGGPGQSGVCTTGTCGSCGMGGVCVGAIPGTTFETAGPTGKCGCGGGGGPGGAGGRGGGASVALFVSSGATVSAVSSVLQAGPGGDGASGASGTPGGDGTPGSRSDDTCTTSCSMSCGTCSNEITLVGGAPGSPGGKGGTGGRGGGGAGGPSIAVVAVGGGIFVQEGGTQLAASRGGQGAAGAPDGESAPLLEPR